MSIAREAVIQIVAIRYRYSNRNLIIYVSVNLYVNGLPPKPGIALLCALLL